MERLLDTGDTTYDWAFNTVPDANGKLDEMWILNGRAQLWIKSATYTIALKAPWEYTQDTAGTWH